jgi:hypothetical protein
MAGDNDWRATTPTSVSQILNDQTGAFFKVQIVWGGPISATALHEFK